MWQIVPAAEFTSIARQWDALNDQAGSIPFLRSAFLQAALTHFGEGGELAALASDHGSVTSALILKRNGPGRWHAFQPSQLPLGPFLQRAETGLGDKSMPELFRALPGVPLLIEITQLDPITTSRPEGSGTASTIDYIETAWVEINGDFEAFWSARGKNLRDNVRKLTKKLMSDGIVARLEQVTDPAQMRSAIEDYAKLETAGWKRSIGTAVSMETAQGRFYVDMMEKMARLAQARAYRYFFNESVVAMDLCVEYRDTMVVLKTAYDESFSKLSPATLMREQIFRNLFAEGRIRRVEFYGPMMEWHTRWTEKSRTLYHVNLFRNRAVKRVAALARMGLRRGKPVAHESVATDAK
jgi:CelD/BcsL family acetyltransferase involved in cellulose biosynthesis